MSDLVHYKIIPQSPGAHLFLVQCHIAKPNPEGQAFFLPTWIPGSYKIRDFAKHVSSCEARSHGQIVPFAKTQKHTWLCEPCEGPLTFEYEVYANDSSIRGAMLDITRGFINPCGLCMLPIGYENAVCEIEILGPQGYIVGTWHVATALQAVDVDSQGFGKYRAQNYQELIDSPIEMAAFTRLTFLAHKIPHQVVITEADQADFERITADLKRLCEYWIDFFGSPIPFSHYVFLIKLASHAYGGLEHGASTSVQFNRFELPTTDHERISPGYREFLSLCSHEYLHTWHVKRIRPQVFLPYDLYHETYTRTLWVFEGITSYYQDLALVRSKLISVDQYVQMLSHAISKFLRTPGRKKQSLSESSFDAWIKFYDPNENSVNAGISYYLKGSLVALLLDLALRSRTQNRISLDDVMKTLWDRYGKTQTTGISEFGFEEIVQELAGDVVNDILSLANTTEELPLDELLATVGLVYTCPIKVEGKTHYLNGIRSQEKTSGASLGVTLVTGIIEAKIATVFDGGAAQRVGLSAGDTILAVNGWRIERADFFDRIDRYSPGEEITIHAFHGDRILVFPVVLHKGDNTNCELTLIKHPDEEVLKQRHRWLKV